MSSNHSHSRGLWLIAAFKLLKGFALLAVGLGSLKLLHKDVVAEAQRVVSFLQIDPNNLFIQRLFAKLSILDDHKLKALSAGTFFYSALLLTEGFGLAFNKTWAKYFSIIVTASFIPLELYELTKHVSVAKGVIVLVNIAVVVYLIREVRQERHSPASADRIPQPQTQS
jgi:uncharacterized membrane protein (DUF2068 family)